MAEYDLYLEQFLGLLAAVQEEPATSAPTDLGDLGVHPTQILSDAFAFDHHCHLRFGILAPYGPISRDVPAADTARIGPGIDWMLAGFPAMCPDASDALTAPLRLDLTGPGGGSWTLSPGSPMNIEEGDQDTGTLVSSDANVFFSWGTTRSPWSEHCTVTGDKSLAAAVLDAMNII